MNQMSAEFETRVLSLPVSQRAHLAERLIASLDGEPVVNNQELWLVEARKRVWEHENGQGEAIPAEQSLREAYERIKSP